jgi:hypothetical protein
MAAHKYTPTHPPTRTQPTQIKCTHTQKKQQHDLVENILQRILATECCGAVLCYAMLYILRSCVAVGVLVKVDPTTLQQQTCDEKLFCILPRRARTHARTHTLTHPLSLYLSFHQQELSLSLSLPCCDLALIKATFQQVLIEEE